MDVIKTWPAHIDARTVASIFRASDAHGGGWSTYYFTLGRAKPRVTPERMWWTYQGRIIGSFPIARIVCNDGSLPKLARLDGEESEWQIKPDAWVALCEEDCRPLRERVFHAGFRGWRYFNLDEYRGTASARMRR